MDEVIRLLKEILAELRVLSGRSGTYPCDSAPEGPVTFATPVVGFTAEEATTITDFVAMDETTINTPYTGKEISAGQTVWFGVPVIGYTVSSGGKGHAYKIKTEL